jgi:DNA-binding MurR/RpiR family transcriptional regulator
LSQAEATIQELLRAHAARLTRAERQVADVLLDDFPFLGLSSITQVAQRAEFLPPSVMRLVQKLGFVGFSAFQETLRAELSAKGSDPIRKRERLSGRKAGGLVLERFTEAVSANLAHTLERLEIGEFEALAHAIADEQRAVFIIGGRITGSLADYLYKHLQVVRSGVRLLGDAPAVWPHHLLDLQPGDLILVFDIRRYENVLLRLAELAEARGAELALFTDQWGSPVGRHARYRFNCRVEAPSAWDSTAVILVLLEALVAQVQELTWATGKARMEALEAMFDRTGLFRKFT